MRWNHLEVHFVNNAGTTRKGFPGTLSLRPFAGLLSGWGKGYTRNRRALNSIPFSPQKPSERRSVKRLKISLKKGALTPCGITANF